MLNYGYCRRWDKNMKIPNKMYKELRIYDTKDLEKYLKFLLDEINSRSKYDKEQSVNK